MMHGLTTKPSDQLVPLAKAWSYPAELKIIGSDKFSSDGYDPSERTYHLTCMENDHPCELIIELKANSDSPVVNPCFVIKNWGRSEPLIKMNENLLEHGKKLRVGHRLALDGTDLLIWIETESTIPLTLSITPR